MNETRGFLGTEVSDSNLVGLRVGLRMICYQETEPPITRKSGLNLAVISQEQTTMKKSKFTDQQISFELKQAASGTPVEEVCRKLGISQQTFYRWKMMAID